MKSSELRTAFLDYFRTREHLITPSASLVPVNDPTLLLINAGMAPLKPYFLDPSKAPAPRMASVQKCLRTKDIDEVGTTPRHLTFFEMLGNFSFGDYFKEEIIPWAWEFVTKDLKLPYERLSVSVFEKDDEAYDIWHKKVELPESKIFRLGEKDNFWFMADTGPCGPDSEIFYDIGVEVGCGRPSCQPGCDCSRFTEIWNLVFTQFDRQQNGELKPLPKKNVDTGMGLERTIAAINHKVSVFEIDLFKPLISYIHEKSGFKGETETKGKIKFNPYFLMADHLRGAAFLIADGVYPGNEGRGYILRRIMRRAFLHSKKQELRQGDLIGGLKFVYETLGDTYPEIINKSSLVEKILEREEEGFLSTLSHGEALLEKEIEKLERDGRKTLNGEIAFVLYDTYGFPLELTKDILREKGFVVDEDEFNKELEKQRERSRVDTQAKLEKKRVLIILKNGNHIIADASRQKSEFIEYVEPYTGERKTLKTDEIQKVEKYSYFEEEGKPFDPLYASIYSDSYKPTEFVGYDVTSAEALILKVTNDVMILDRTPFYADSGGQIGDFGEIKNDQFLFKVTRTVKDEYGIYYHHGGFKKGDASIAQSKPKVTASVDLDIRKGIMRAHSATHLLHTALRKRLGNHIRQAGSHVEDDRLRFDFTHFEAIPFDILIGITRQINQWIYQGLKIQTENMPYKQAIANGAIAIFGEKYGDTVRVVKMSDEKSDVPDEERSVSIELCGGTHLDDTSLIGCFIIRKEESIGSGIRRIEALTGEWATTHFIEKEELIKKLSTLFAVSNEDLMEAVEHMFKNKKAIEKELEKSRFDMARTKGMEILQGASVINKTFVITYVGNNFDNDFMINMLEGIKNKVTSYAALIIGKLPDKMNIVLGLSDDLVKKGFKAGDMIREICEILGGGGGGRPDIAQGGGKDPSRINDAFDKFQSMLMTREI